MWTEQVELRLQELLGEGSQGRVFKALRRDRRTGLSQTVAVKILHSRNAVELWRNEFESLLRVRSPYCVQVLSFERVQGHPALVLEYVEGVTLRDLVNMSVLSLEEIAEIRIQIEVGLRDLAREKLFHGDLSPHNVMVDHEGRIRLFDFGLANSQTQHARLTPEFAAPERLQGQKPSLNSDLFSLQRLEAFLKGDRQHERTEGSPSRRFSSPVQQQKTLARKVREIRATQNAIRAQTTKVLNRTGPKERTPSFSLASGLLFLLLGSSSPHLHGEGPFAVLRIRTQKWFSVRLDGRSPIYTPADIGIPDQKTHALEWQNHHQRGRLTIQMNPGQVLTLHDRDLTH